MTTIAVFSRACTIGTLSNMADQLRSVASNGLKFSGSLRMLAPGLKDDMTIQNRGYRNASAARSMVAYPSARRMLCSAVRSPRGWPPMESTGSLSNGAVSAGIMWVILTSVLLGPKNANRYQGQQENQHHQDEGVRGAGSQIGGSDVVVQVKPRGGRAVIRSAARDDIRLEEHLRDTERRDHYEEANRSAHQRNC